MVSGFRPGLLSLPENPPKTRNMLFETGMSHAVLKTCRAEEPMEISDNCVASIHYTLINDEGETVDSSRERGPLSYLHGAGNIVPGLEAALAGKKEGDQFKAEIPPSEAYGEHNPEMVQQVPKSAFQGAPEIQPGMQFQAEGPQGASLITVREVGDDTVTVDANHPMAGKTLHFDVEVTDVREATSDERNNGQPQEG